MAARAARSHAQFYPQRQEEGSVQRWGGLSGICGALLFVVIFGIVAILAGPEPPGPAGPISRFPEIRTARTIENGLYLAVLVLWVPLTLALAHRLSRSRPAPTLFGAALSLMGLTVLATGALPHFVTFGLSDRYHAVGATADERATLVLQWQAAQDMFDALLSAGLLVIAVGVTLIGVAMHADPDFGKVVGKVSVMLGVVAFIAALVMLIEPMSVAAAVGIFALIGFHLIAGWKAYRISKNR